MIKIDLITGFLGSGKTTFIRHYAGHFLEAGQRICILENDFGAINVDRVLLEDLSDESEYLMASQCACAGRLILSRTQLWVVRTRIQDGVSGGGRLKYGTAYGDQRFVWIDTANPAEYKVL